MSASLPSLLGICFALAAVATANRDRIRLADMSVITLQAGAMTAGRRSAPVAQLTCACLILTQTRACPSTPPSRLVTVVAKHFGAGLAAFGRDCLFVLPFWPGVGGTAQCSQQPTSVLCRNTGSDGRDATWKCETDLPAGYKLAHVSVSCEGYDYPDDPYVLYGSCGLSYKIDGTGL